MTTTTYHDLRDAANLVGRWMRHTEDPVPEGLLDYLIAAWREDGEILQEVIY